MTAPENGTADRERARRMYAPLELLHISIYFAPEPQLAYRELGMKGMGGYFASRSAAMGAVPAEVVTAAFYVFAPAVVERAIPAAWGLASPAQFLSARLAALDGCWRRVLGDELLGSPEVAEAAALARDACSALRPEGRALYAGHASLPWPVEPHLQLWHAATLLREHRGDGHVAALVHAPLDAAESVVSYSAVSGTRDFLRATRGWSDEQWAAAEARLRGRGLLEADGSLTAQGAALRRHVEQQTDTAAAAPWRHLGDDGCARLLELLDPLVAGLRAADAVPPGLAG
jgi:hypothetical protein